MIMKTVCLFIILSILLVSVKTHSIRKVKLSNVLNSIQTGNVHEILKGVDCANTVLNRICSLYEKQEAIRQEARDLYKELQEGKYIDIEIEISVPYRSFIKEVIRKKKRLIKSLLKI